MNDLLIPLEETDVRELQYVVNRLDTTLGSVIETINDKDYVRVKTLYELMEQLSYEIDRLKEELYEKEDEENGI